MTYICSDERII